ncbi:MAG: ATP-binding protein [Kofleriaceae bacterium]|nr:ATP-binding protein [Kofleriaceae bacterium]MCB9572665.1 ATP-binding protein [Kofleriaceae bacterium]
MSAERVDLAVRHLVLRLRPLQRALVAAIARREAHTAHLAVAGAHADAITADHARAVLAALADLPSHASYSVGAPPAGDDEAAADRRLVEAAAALGWRPPLVALAEDLGLDDFEQQVVLLCAAAELDPGFATVFGFLHDDAARRAPSVELACTLTATSVLERIARRQALAPHGRLRRLGVIAVRDADRGGLGLELALTAPALAFVLGGAGTATGHFHDPAEVAVGDDAAAPHGLDGGVFLRIALMLTRGDLDLVGVFGGRQATRDDAVRALAARSGLPLRRWRAGDAAGLDVAAALGALVWLDADALDGTAPDPIDALIDARVPLVVSGGRPWRPARLLIARAGRYTELAVAEPDRAERVALWQAALPELTADHAVDLGTRYRFAEVEIRAAVGVAGATAASLRNGRVVTAVDCIDRAAAVVARPTALRFGTLIDPRRGPADLVLPDGELGRVLEIAAYHRHGDKVQGEWGFAHRLTGAGGVKALFAGESGTGKTLAAEVVAGLLGLPLLKIDLARVVSKWVGETEKNLDAAFREAEDGHAVLFFDEAEALFGSRGDVRTGADRYANLEVSFLLQRLDGYAGVAILATNLRDKIDPAFTRRFHVVVGFRRPQRAERARLWQLAFPADAPVGADVALDDLVRLDLTGAGIVGAAQSAALLAADEGAAEIAMEHVVRGVARQFQREARVLTAGELGRHAHYLEQP